MKSIHIIALILLFSVGLLACTSQPKKSNTRSTKPSDKVQIYNLFQNWRNEEIRLGHFFAKDSCNPAWFQEHEFNGTIDAEWGIPDLDEVGFSYADLNGDGKLDALIQFNPIQCDGGNASMWSQITLFALSGKNQYTLTESIDVSKFKNTDFDKNGFYWLDSIAENRIIGTYIEFLEDDGHCCPSIQKQVIFDFKKKSCVKR